MYVYQYTLLICLQAQRRAIAIYCMKISSDVQCNAEEEKKKEKRRKIYAQSYF